MMNRANPITLSAEQAAFIQGNVTMYVAAIGTDLSPQIVRAAGCRVDANNRQVTIFVSAARAGALLAAVRSHRTLAAVFSQPGNHKAMQLKSADAEVVELQRADATLITRYCERLIAHIAPFGFTPAMLRAFLSIPIGDAVALQFTPAAAFDQTPGPNAGAALRMSA
jgi:hypothetical protein